MDQNTSCALLIPQIPLSCFYSFLFLPKQIRRKKKSLPSPKLNCLEQSSPATWDNLQSVETNRGRTASVSTFPHLCWSKNTDCWFGNGRWPAALPPAATQRQTATKLWWFRRSKVTKAMSEAEKNIFNVLLQVCNYCSYQNQQILWLWHNLSFEGLLNITQYIWVLDCWLDKSNNSKRCHFQFKIISFYTNDNKT